jgi:two-component system, chemotaxis family, chemotaxis protein CheY
MARILVVDDDRSLRELLRMHLSGAGHSVKITCDAEEAIRAMLAEDFELILSDISMPYMDGLELLRAIRGDPKTSHIPVVFLTGHADDASWMEAMKSGATGYVTKPIKTKELVLEIDKALAVSAKQSGKPGAALRIVGGSR